MAKTHPDDEDALLATADSMDGHKAELVASFLVGALGKLRSYDSLAGASVRTEKPLL